MQTFCSELNSEPQMTQTSPESRERKKPESEITLDATDVLISRNNRKPKIITQLTFTVKRKKSRYKS